MLAVSAIHSFSASAVGLWINAAASFAGEIEFLVVSNVGSRVK